MKTLTERFEAYHAANPNVYDMFVLFTQDAILAGKTKLSHWLIINRIRWESDIVVRTVEPFKISNDFVALYARKYMKEHPEHGEIFNTKEMKRK